MILSELRLHDRIDHPTLERANPIYRRDGLITATASANGFTYGFVRVTGGWECWNIQEGADTIESED
jgi:hypothetical protein